MFLLKRCPRCNGDLYTDSDAYGFFVTCVQCGFSRDLPSKLGDGRFGDYSETEVRKVTKQSPVTPEPVEGKKGAHVTGLSVRQIAKAHLELYSQGAGGGVEP